MFVIYVFLVHLAFVLLWPLLVLHPKLREGVRSRFGFHPEGWPELSGRPRIWFHGASAGDLLAIEPVVRELKRRRADCAVLVTTVTNSGMVVARKGLAGVDACGYLPYDLPWAVNRVLKRVKPDLLVLEYAEIWPALIRAAKNAGAKIVLTNGRFHERALGRYRLLYWLIGNPLKQIDLLCMREQAEAEHALAIGAPAGRVRVTGNTKFDRLARLERRAEVDSDRVDGLRAELGLDGETPVWVAGSTHDGEEGDLLDVYLALRADHPQLRLVIAPRYVERASKIGALAEERDLPWCLRSACLPSTEPGGAQVIVIDTVGELVDVYRLASVVFVGGSFVKRGGQNILEPAACGKPVLFGPHMENFADSVRILVGRGGLQLPDPQRLQRTLGELLTQPAEALELGRLARAAVLSIQGASQANTQAILELLDRPEGRAK